MDDDEFGLDADTLAAFARVEAPRKIQQPAPQKLDRPAPQPGGSSHASKVVQPTPQALPSRSVGSSILVSPRQKGNPVLTNIRSVAWEYSDIPADYVLGVTTCALFLSLKYHRLHPEYIYNRIRNLQGKYNLRLILTMVDIANHEDSLRELSKTSLINNVTLILCWSAAEAARYLELYKSFEHAAPTAIRSQQSTTYQDAIEDFVTVPRSINARDAALLLSNFGSLRNAVNAGPDELTLLAGWGDKKVRTWCAAVQQPFRVASAAKRSSAAARGRRPPQPLREMVGRRPPRVEDEDEDVDAAVAMAAVDAAEMSSASAGGTGVVRSAVSEGAPAPAPARVEEEKLSSGITAALEKLRKNS